MRKFRLLLLDANVVIYLFTTRLWSVVVEKCEIHLARGVVDESTGTEEEDEYDYGSPIDLEPYEKNGDITVFDVPASQVQSLKDMFDPTYLEKLDPGESASLARLVHSDEGYLICSSDRIVFRVLGNLGRGEQGISLEEVLQKIGHARELKSQYTKAFREKWTSIGFMDGICGRGRIV